MPGHFALILHAHLPFVRHPEHEHFIEEEWLFKAITEAYIPLLRAMQQLVGDWRERKRNRKNPQFRELAEFYIALFSDARRHFADE
jgi:hypothetical protein